MNQPDYEIQNRAKASFGAAYTARTPHRYLNNMTAVNYRMADCMRPYLSAVVDASISSKERVCVLDIGCSYGLSGALLKTGCTYLDLVEFYRQETSLEYASCVSDALRWLDSHAIRKGVKIVGFDSSEQAVRFAAASHMIDDGITVNLEEEKSGLTADDAHLIQQCDVLMSTGAIGYVTEKTVNPILDEFGEKARGALGPVALMSVLELFDPSPIAEAFTKHGYRFEQLPIRLPQRRFVNKEEREDVFKRLQQRGLPGDVLGSENQMFAVLCIAAKPERFNALAACVTGVLGASPL